MLFGKVIVRTCQSRVAISYRGQKFRSSVRSTMRVPIYNETVKCAQTQARRSVRGYAALIALTTFESSGAVSCASGDRHHREGFGAGRGTPRALCERPPVLRCPKSRWLRRPSATTRWWRRGPRHQRLDRRHSLRGQSPIYEVRRALVTRRLTRSC